MKRKNILSSLWQYMKKSRLSLAGAVIFALASGGLSLLGPYYIGRARGRYRPGFMGKNPVLSYIPGNNLSAERNIYVPDEYMH